MPNKFDKRRQKSDWSTKNTFNWFFLENIIFLKKSLRKRRVQFRELCCYFPAKNQFFNKLLIKTPVDYWKIIKLFIFLSNSFLLKKLLWTEKNTTLRIDWKFFAEVQKAPTHGVKRNWRQSLTKKDTVFLEKNPVEAKNPFFSTKLRRSWQKYVFYPQTPKKNILEIKEKITKMFIFPRQNFPHRKVL